MNGHEHRRNYGVVQKNRNALVMAKSLGPILGAFNDSYANEATRKPVIGGIFPQVQIDNWRNRFERATGHCVTMKLVLCHDPALPDFAII